MALPGPHPGARLEGEHLWPGLCPWNPAGHSLKEQWPTTWSEDYEWLVHCELGVSQDGGDPWTRYLAFGTWNVTTGGEGPWASAGSWVALARDSQVCLHAQHGLWKPTPWEGFDLLLAPWLSHHVSEFSLVNESVAFQHLQVGDRHMPCFCFGWQAKQQCRGPSPLGGPGRGAGRPKLGTP